MNQPYKALLDRKKSLPCELKVYISIQHLLLISN